MVYAKVIDKIVVATTINKPSNMDGWVALEGTLPPRPIAEDDTEPRLMLVDGQLAWQVGKTEEELAEERRQAYVAECDTLSMAYIGYMLEGDEAKAMSARASYLARKAEIRERFKENEQ
jgi:hypothetical protein